MILRRLFAHRPAKLDHLVLFIGHHKVGSSALQAYFVRHARRYGENGVLYPWVTAEGQRYFEAKTPQAAGTMSLNTREPHNALAFAMLSEAQSRPVPPFLGRLPTAQDMFLRIRDQITAQTPHSLVLVSEVFANFGQDAPELIARLAETLPARKVTIYASFRRIDDYLTAWHAQRLRFGHTMPPLRDAAVQTYQGTIHLEFARVLRGWRCAFPRAEYILRSYDEVTQSGGAIGDFLSRVGLPKFDGHNMRRNRSLHPALMPFQTYVNEVSTPEAAKACLTYLIRTSKDLDLPDSHRVEMFGQAQRNQIADAFAASDAHLGQWVGRKRFFPLSTRIRQPRAIKLCTASDIAIQSLGRQPDLPVALQDLLPKFLPRVDAVT